MNPKEKIKVGIVGGAGYTAGELIRLLVFHPFVELVSITSTSQFGKAVSSVHDDLLPLTNLYFTEKLTGEEDILFLCLGHSHSGKFLKENPIKESTKIIDLSNEFRLKNDQEFMGREFVYGLVELQREEIKKAQNIANPGCFATAIQLALLPLAAENKLNSDINISAITGSTGAGRSLTDTSHFSWRNNNVSTYKNLTHQHLDEIKESLSQLQTSFSHQVYFIPYRGNFTRGILATIYLPFQEELEVAIKLYEDYYKDQAFTFISTNPIHLKQVVNTNNCFIHVDKIEGQLVISSVIDNLLKGASGQAVQNMNLMYGWDEKTALELKASYF